MINRTIYLMVPWVWGRVLFGKGKEDERMGMERGWEGRYEGSEGIGMGRVGEVMSGQIKITMG